MKKLLNPNPTIETVYQGWQSGDYTAQEALNLFCGFISQVQDITDPLEITMKQVRAYVSEVVEYLGGTADVSGFGELKITNPSVTYSYDKKLVEQLGNQLRTEGLGDVAARLDNCLKSSERAGSLRITRSKEKEEVPV